MAKRKTVLGETIDEGLVDRVAFSAKRGAIVKVPKRPKAKDVVVRFRCTSKQKAAMRRMAEAAGISLSSWLVWLGMREFVAAATKRGR